MFENKDAQAGSRTPVQTATGSSDSRYTTWAYRNFVFESFIKVSAYSVQIGLTFGSNRSPEYCLTSTHLSPTIISPSPFMSTAK